MIVGGRIIALAPPDELRRLATNGDLLDIETAAMFDGAEPDRHAGRPRGHARTARATCGSSSTTRAARCPASSSGSRRPAARSSRPASSGSRSTRSSRSSSPATTTSAAPSEAAGGRRRPTADPTRRPRHEPLQDPDPDPRDRRQGARLDPPPAGRAAQPRPRAVPDHGHLRRSATAATAGRSTRSSSCRPSSGLPTDVEDLPGRRRRGPPDRRR